MFTRTAWLAALVGVVLLPTGARAQTQDDFAQVAEKMAPQIRQKVVAKVGGQQCRVAVFPFGDSDGKVTLDLYEPNTVLQGELIVNLMKLSQGKYLVLDKPGLQKEFRAAGTDPSGVASNDPKNTAAILKKIGVDVAVVGSIDAKSTAQVAKDRLKKVNVSLTMVYQDGTAEQLAGEASAKEITPPDTKFSTRFRVQLFLTGGGATTELPLVTSKNGDSKLFNVMFAEIPDTLAFGTDAASYKIRVSNTGEPPVKFGNPRDKERLYGVAVLVDGVNSHYQDRGDGTAGPVVVHPRNAAKWVLSGPGQRLVPDPTRPNGYRLDRVADAGHSVIDVPGFQKDAKTADKFLFAPARESIAETVGITNDIGVISVYFYPEDLDGDVQVFFVNQGMSLGTKPGAPVNNPVFTVKPKMKPEPVEVWRIFYRKKGDCPIRPEDRIPIEAIK